MLRSQNKAHGIRVSIILRNAVQKEKTCKKFRVDEIKIKNTKILDSDSLLSMKRYHKLL